MSYREKYQAILETLSQEALEWLQKLVSINSFTYNREGVNRNGKICIEMFSSLGFEPRIVPALQPKTGDHVFLTRKGKSRQNIILVSHLDTVYTEEEERENAFFWREEKEKIYGPGVADIKGGTVMIYLVLKALQEKNPSLLEEWTWHILLNANEEDGCEDFPPLARSYVDEHSKVCLVYEFSKEMDGGKIEFIEARKGACRFLVETFGRQAHSGSGHIHGANAIREMARLVEKMESLTDYEKGITLNVGKIQGGLAINRVPDYACAMVDGRSKTMEDYQWIQEKLKSFSGPGSVESLEDSFPCTIEIHTLSGYPPWPINPQSQWLSGEIIECAHRLGMEAEASYKGGASDGSHFWDLLPTIDGMGVCGANIHCSIQRPEEGKEQEFFWNFSWVKKGLLNLAFLERLSEHRFQ